VGVRAEWWALELSGAQWWLPVPSDTKKWLEVKAAASWHTGSGIINLVFVQQVETDDATASQEGRFQKLEETTTIQLRE